MKTKKYTNLSRVSICSVKRKEGKTEHERRRSEFNSELNKEKP